VQASYFGVPNPNWIEHAGQDIVDLLVDANGKTALDAAKQAAGDGLALLTVSKLACLPCSPYITGQIIGVNGGKTAS
jgi:hypothetical protein